MVRFVLRYGLLAALLGAGAWYAQRWARMRRVNDEHRFRVPRVDDAISGLGLAVDHERAPGVPPEANDDYLDLDDQISAESFPASDPPARW